MAVHRVLLRSSRSPLRGLWLAAYRASARLWAAYLGAGTGRATTYARGSLTTADFVPGLSDADVVIVLPSDPVRPGSGVARVRERWLALRRALPSTSLVLDYPRVYEQSELDGLVGHSALTYGLDDSDGGRAAYRGPATGPDAVRMLERPGLYGGTAGWRRLSGPARLPAERGRDAQLRRVAAWLELGYWWQWAFPACIDPSGPRTAHLCLKLVSEPARIWLWLAHGERAADRREALHRALLRMPEEEEPLRRALELQRALAHSPAPPLAQVLPVLVRLSARIAALIAAETEDQGVTQVRLAGGDGADLLLAEGRRTDETGLTGRGDLRLLPLCDWRSLVWPRRPDYAFMPLAGDPADPAVLAAAAARDEGHYLALLARSLLILPAANRQRARLRAIQCAATDPVSFALAAGDRVAHFPNVRGWSAQDTARRAVAEHRAWLHSGTERDGSRSGLALAMLLTAARAALFLDSLESADPPELALTVAETARKLAARSPAARGVADEALGAYRAFALGHAQPSNTTVSALGTLVESLPPYCADGDGQVASTRPGARQTLSRHSPSSTLA